MTMFLIIRYREGITSATKLEKVEEEDRETLEDLAKDKLIVVRMKWMMLLIWMRLIQSVQDYQLVFQNFSVKDSEEELFLIKL